MQLMQFYVLPCTYVTRDKFCNVIYIYQLRYKLAKNRTISIHKGIGTAVQTTLGERQPENICVKN